MNIKNKYVLVISLIFFISCILRFYNYSSRWMFNQDDARDAIIARYAISEAKIPLIGPPSSAGPFSFGPLYYWVVITLSLLFYPLVNGAWFGFSLISAIVPLIVFYTAKKSGGLVFAFMSGIIAALSPALVDYSTGMTNPILSGLAVFVVLYSIVSYLKNGEEKYSVLLGLSLGLAINSHFQSVGLVLVIPTILFVSKFKLRKKILSLIVSTISLFVSFIPLLIFNLKNNWVWISSVANYFLHGQGKFFIPIRWLTDIRDFWPMLFGKVILGNEKLGIVLVLLCLVAGLLAFRKKWVTRDIVIIVLTFFFQIIAIRYYKGPRLAVYFVFVYPILIYLSSWAIYIIWKLNKYMGILLFLGVITVSLLNDTKIVVQTGQSEKIINLKNSVTKMDFRKFVFYSHDSSKMLSLPLFYLFYRDGLIDNQSKYNIGACDNFLQVEDKCTKAEENQIMTGRRLAQYEGYRVYNLTGLKETEIIKLGFSKMNQDVIYNQLFINYPNAK